MRFPFALITLAAFAAFAAEPVPPVTPDKKPRTVKLLMRDGLRFDPPRFSAAPGEEIVLRIENADSTQQTHNFLLLKPGQRDAVVQEALALGEKGPAQGYVPENPNILVHSSLVEADKVATVKFRVPDEKAVYPFVCTFPGHGFVMYGAIYAGVPLLPLEKDPHIPPMTMQAMIAGNGRRPFVQRVFMPDAGPAAIAVALSDDQNFCWDAGQCRLRYAWKGAFIDASAHWKGNGRDLAKLPAAPWWHAPKDAFPLRFGAADADAPPVKFLGYRLDQGVPEFHYRAGDVEVFEKIVAAEKGAALAVRYRVPNSKQPVFYEGRAQGADFTITLTPAQP